MAAEDYIPWECLGDDEGDIESAWSLEDSEYTDDAE